MLHIFILHTQHTHDMAQGESVGLKVTHTYIHTHVSWHRARLWGSECNIYTYIHTHIHTRYLAQARQWGSKCHIHTYIHTYIHTDTHITWHKARQWA